MRVAHNEFEFEKIQASHRACDFHLHGSLTLPSSICLIPASSSSSLHRNMPQSYKCLCSRCNGGSKSITKRSIEIHLQRDQALLQSLPPHTDVAISVKSCINQMIELLSEIYGGHTLPDLVSDLEGSHPVSSEGVL